MYIQIHIYICICIHIYIYVYIYIYIYIHTCIHIYIDIFIYLHIYVHASKQIYIYDTHMYVNSNICTFIFIYIYICIYIYSYTFITLYTLQSGGGGITPQGAERGTEKRLEIPRTAALRGSGDFRNRKDAFWRRGGCWCAALRGYVVSHMNASCHTSIRHVTHELVVSHMNESCHT